MLSAVNQNLPPVGPSHGGDELIDGFKNVRFGVM